MESPRKLEAGLTSFREAAGRAAGQQGSRTARQAAGQQGSKAAGQQGSAALEVTFLHKLEEVPSQHVVF